MLYCPVCAKLVCHNAGESTAGTEAAAAAGACVRACVRACARTCSHDGLLSVSDARAIAVRELKAGNVQGLLADMVAKAKVAHDTSVRYRDETIEQACAEAKEVLATNLTRMRELLDRLHRRRLGELQALVEYRKAVADGKIARAKIMMAELATLLEMVSHVPELSEVTAIHVRDTFRRAMRSDLSIPCSPIVRVPGELHDIRVDTTDDALCAIVDCLGIVTYKGGLYVRNEEDWNRNYLTSNARPSVTRW